MQGRPAGGEAVTRRGNVIYRPDGTAVHAETGAVVPLGVWAAAGTPVEDPYPCRCEPGRRCNPKWCPCFGRIGDLDHLPATCCAKRAAS